ncbi:hypothetical protein Tco_0292458, partial [Tanacetum coccineum]
KSIHEPKHVVPMDVEEAKLDNVANDADEPQVDAIPKSPKQDWFMQPPSPETAQNKLFNLEGDVIVDFVTALKMFTQRIIVQNKVEDVQLGVESYQIKLNLTKP